MSGLDYAVIGFYLLFMLGIGWAFRPFNSDSSDYFRGGGAMQWWMTGASTFMVTFSAWTFTGAAGEIYKTGTLVLALYFSNAIANLVVLAFTAKRFRRMRAVTYTEAVGDRFGPTNERVFLLVQLPVFVIVGAIWLNAIGVFMAAAFGSDIRLTMAVLGVIVLVMSTSGGAWAVVASDFVQMLIVATITVVVAVLVLRLPEVGGVSGLVAKVPAEHFDWQALLRPQVIGVYVAGMIIGQCVQHNDIANGGSRYLTVKNGRHARLAVLIPLTGMVAFPLIWLVPPMAAAIDLDLATMLPGLSKNPGEGAYVAMAMRVLPAGLLGLFVCGIFAATMSSMDSGLNKAAGVFVRSFYLPTLRPNATESHLLRVGRVFTVVLGVLMISLALVISQVRTVGLFDLVISFASVVSLPIAVPMLWGLFVGRTPSWTAWSTALVGFLVALTVRYLVPLDAVSGLLGLAEPLNPVERGDLLYGTTVLCVFVAGTVWFFATRFTGVAPTEVERAERFLTKTRTPLTAEEQGVGIDSVQFKVMGVLCLVYGGFVMLLAVAPQAPAQRLACLFCGGFVVLVGLLLTRASARAPRHTVAAS
ncbi:MAG: transporter [Planctomycetota bacterium]